MCEVFLQPFDFEPIACRFYIQFQRFSAFLIGQINWVIYANLPLCNTQQGYSPRWAGRGSKRAASTSSRTPPTNRAQNWLPSGRSFLLPR